MTLDGQAEEYLDNISNPTSAKAHTNALLAFAAWRAADRIESLLTLDADCLVRFMRWLEDAGYSHMSVKLYTTLVAEFLAHANDKGWLRPGFDIERMMYRKGKKMKRLPYPERDLDPDFKKLISYYDHQPEPSPDDRRHDARLLDLYRNRALIHVLFSTAGRAMEVRALDRKQVQNGRAQTTRLRTTKGGKPRIVYFTPDARLRIRAYLAVRKDEFEPLFVNHGKNKGQRISTTTIWKIVKKAARALKIDARPHDFRHYRASDMLERGRPIEEIQQVLGHSSPTITRTIYAHYGDARQAEIAARSANEALSAARLGEE